MQWNWFYQTKQQEEIVNEPFFDANTSCVTHFSKTSRNVKNLGLNKNDIEEDVIPEPVSGLNLLERSTTSLSSSLARTPDSSRSVSFDEAVNWPFIDEDIDESEHSEHFIVRMHAGGHQYEWNRLYWH